MKVRKIDSSDVGDSKPLKGLKSIADYICPQGVDRASLSDDEVQRQCRPITLTGLADAQGLKGGGEYSQAVEKLVQRLQRLRGAHLDAYQEDRRQAAEAVVNEYGADAILEEAPESAREAGAADVGDSTDDREDWAVWTLMHSASGRAEPLTLDGIRATRRQLRGLRDGVCRFEDGEIVCDADEDE